MTIIVLPDEIDYDIGSMHFVNPLTALGLVDRIIENGSAAGI